MKTTQQTIAGARGFVLTAMIFQVLATALQAAPPASPLVLELTTGLPGKQARLTWQATPGFRYRVEKSSDLSPGSWQRVAQVEASGASAEWLDPEAVKTRCFYRVTEPGPEVFSIEPPILSETGGALLITGQALPPGGSLAMDIEGVGRIVTPFTEVTDPEGRVSWQVVLEGSFAPGALVSNIAILDAGGIEIIPVNQTLSITPSGYADDAPATLPPGAPLTLGASKPVPGIGVIVKKHPPSSGSKREVTNPLYTGGGPRGNNPLYQGSARTGKDVGWLKNSGIGSEPPSFNRISPASSGLPGEVSFHFDALSLPNFAGPPLAWIMTYRSTRPVSSGHGPQWDFSYNIRIEAANSSAAKVTVHDGGGRADVFHRQSDGTYRCDGLFREGKFTGDTFTLTFADQGKWVFLPLGSSPKAGKIDSITDRNGVALNCTYDASGRLSSVNDGFGRYLSVLWDTSGTVPRISSVSDHAGRSVFFGAYSGGASDDGGPDGTLKSISCPRVTGSPPHSQDMVFTYSEGLSDERLNHNLLTITDGKNRVLEGFGYSSDTNPHSVDYDRCASHNRRTGHVTLIKRTANSSGGYTSYEADEIGRLTEIDCDRQHRVLAIRQFTGYCTPPPTIPEEVVTNRPTGKLRGSDPDFFETRLSWNPDHSLTRITDAAGSQLILVYDREFRAACPVRERGNVRTMTIRSASGEERVVSCDYLPGFGPHESARPRNPIRGMTVKGGRNPSPDLLIWSPRSNILDPDDDGDGVPTIDEVLLARHKGWDGKVKGSNSVVDSFPGGNLERRDEDGEFKSLFERIDTPINKHNHRAILRRTHFQEQIAGAYEDSIAARAKEEGGRHTPFHNKYRPQYLAKERGITINTSHIEYETSRIIGGEQCDDGGVDDDCDLFRKILDYGEAGENRAFTTRLVTAHGQALQWNYDEHGNRTAYIAALPNRGALYQYDSKGRCTGVTLNNGGEPPYQATFSYNSTTGFLQSATIDPGGLAITTEYAYDSIGRCTGVVDPLGNTWTNEYSPSDQIIRRLSPPHGTPATRTASIHRYDQGGFLVRCDVDELDSDGEPVTAGAARTTFFVRDERACLVRIAEEERPVNVGDTALEPDPTEIQKYAVADFTHNAAGEVIRVSTPMACREAAADLACDFSYDERGLLYESVDGGAGATSTVTDRCDYTPDGLLARHTRVGSGVPGAVTIVAYDGFRRPSTITDPMGNVAAFSHDNRGGITCSIFGQTNDVEGAIGNVLLAQTFIQTAAGRDHTAVLAIACSGGPDDTGSFLSLPGVQDVCYDLKLNRSSESIFQRWFVKDDTIIQDRFESGQTTPLAQETTVITRSSTGLPMQVACNGDILVSISRDTAGRENAYWNVALGMELQRDSRGSVVQCSTTHLRAGAPPKTFTMHYAYDALGRMTSQSDSVANTTSYAYDFLGRVVSIERPGGLVIRFDYNGTIPNGTPDGAPFSRRVSTDLDGDGAPDIVISSYSRCGELKSTTDALGYMTSFQHDSLGRLIRCDHPDGTNETQTYDSLGFPNVASFRDVTTQDDDCDFNGRVITRTVDHPDPGIDDIVTNYTHDGLGRVCTCHQGYYAVTLNYDSLGNRIRETQGGVNVESTHDDVHVDSTFDHRGRASLQTSLQNSYQLHQTEQRDGLGRLLSITDASADATSPPVVSFEHLGLLVSKSTYANGVSSEFTYHGDGDVGTTDFSFGARPTKHIYKQLGTKFAETIITRNRDQDVVSETTLYTDNPDGPGRSKSFTRDPLGRITGCLMTRREAFGALPVTELDVSYTLDVRGDRITATGGANPGSYDLISLDAARGRYTTWPGGDLSWDANGNLTSMGRAPAGVTHEYHYDALGRLTTVTDGSGTTLITCVYDGFDRLIKMTAGSSPAIHFVYDGSTCVQELADDGSATMNFITSGGAVHSMKTGGGETFYPVVCGDEFRSASGDNTPIIRGSALGGLNKDPKAFVRMMTDASGAVVEQFDCDDACKPVFLSAAGIPSSAASSATGLRWLAPGCAWLPETAMFSCPGSVYSPELGTTAASGKGKGGWDVKSNPIR